MPLGRGQRNLRGAMCRGRRPRRPAWRHALPGGVVGRPAPRPPRRGQDPSLRCNPEKGYAVKPRAAEHLRRTLQWAARTFRGIVGGGVPDAPRVARAFRGIVGRPAHRPPRRGQDPSLQCKPEKGDAVRPRAAYMPPLQSGKMFQMLNFIKFTLIKPNF